MLDSPEGVCAGQTGSEYPATSVPFSRFLADIGFALIKSMRSRPVVCRAGCLALATGAPAAARWRLERPSGPAPGPGPRRP
jgi:hypothetical protein